MKTTYVLMLWCLLAGCVPSTILQNPMHGSMTPYLPTPLSGDKPRTAIYADGGITYNTVNDYNRDAVIAGWGGIHAAHSFKWFQLFYGGSFTVGGYQHEAIDNTGNAPYNHDGEMKHFGFGSAGLVGGGNLVVRGTKVEWRALGAELAWQKEWGSYYNWRKQINPQTVEFVDQSQIYTTLTFTSDITWKVKRGADGIKVGYGFPLRSMYSIGMFDSTKTMVYPHHITSTVHFTRERLTFYCQVNFGYYLGGVNLGVSYRLTK